MSAPVNDGGPAFPVPGLHEDADFNGMFLRDYFAASMFLRDYFAAKAMQGTYTNPIPATREEKEYIAQHAYAMADAMLKARGA